MKRAMFKRAVVLFCVAGALTTAGIGPSAAVDTEYWSGTLAFSRSFDTTVANGNCQEGGTLRLVWQESWTLTGERTAMTSDASAFAVTAAFTGSVSFTATQNCAGSDPRTRSGSYSGSGTGQILVTRSGPGGLVSFEGAFDAAGLPGSETATADGTSYTLNTNPYRPRMSPVAIAGVDGAFQFSGPVSAQLGDGGQSLGSDVSATDTPVGSASLAMTRELAPVTPPVVKPLPPTAACDVYWTRPGTTLTVPPAVGLLRNDSDPQRRPISPRVKAISFGRATHPFTVTRAGGLTIRTTNRDRALIITYAVVNNANLESRPTRVTILVSAVRPSTAELAPCKGNLDRVIRGANSTLPTAAPSNTPANLQILKDAIASKAKWDTIKSKRTQAPYKAMDFAQDGCSQPGFTKPIPQYDFTPACVRHDFNYRNAMWMGVFNKYKKASDDAFRTELLRFCEEKVARLVRPACRTQATTFAQAVATAGGLAAPEKASSWDSAARVRVHAVFQPVDNFYIRGVLEDTKSDGHGVRLEASPAQNGFNPLYRTVARNSKGKGTVVFFDFSYNGVENLKGVFFRLCVDSDRDDPQECGPRFYVNKP